ncbi:hypothetical protein SNE40_023561 [Patella caerulea]|uniref:FAM234A/B beta-propeller domain-containing protein n=1 Tax=Patella caerulea TaxID=87958 RepID=A0AAN8FW71_PATCE
MDFNYYNLALSTYEQRVQTGVTKSDMFSKKDKTESRVVFKKKGGHRNGYVNDEYHGDDNEEGYSDEDDVFVEDPLDASSATKPLMHPRQRTRVKSKHPECKCKVMCKPVLYFVIFVSILGGLMSVILYTMNKHSHKNNPNTNKLKVAPSSSKDSVIGCDHVEVEDVWVVGMPKLLTESAFRLVDVNQDGVLDVLLGFATGGDGYDITDLVCEIYFNGTLPCFGGILALDGMTGKELWRTYSNHEVFALNCNVDLDQDGVKDCLGGGRAGVFDAISGKEGKLLWRFGDADPENSIMNLYTAQYVNDMDGDSVPDIFAVHGGDPLQSPNSAFRLSGKLMFFSGKTGKVLRELGVPDNKEAYYSPQIYLQEDGTEIVLFGTGGETHGGSLWAIGLHDLQKGHIDKAARIYTDNLKGVMTPAALIDLTHDGVEDIVIAMFNSSVMAIDGKTFGMLWNYTFPESESYATPSVGYYNDDDVPDFMVKYAFGPGYPIYYNATTTVLDGRTGTPMITPFIRDGVGAQASALTLSIEGRGNDLFLYWIADCIQHEGEGGVFDFVKGTNVHEQSRADFCRLRFKTKGFTKMLALNSNMKVPGTKLYFSEERKVVEHAYWINTTLEAIDFVRSHPEHLKAYDYYASNERKTKTEDVEPNQKNINTEESGGIGPDTGTRTSSGKKGPPNMQMGGRKQYRRPGQYNSNQQRNRYQQNHGPNKPRYRQRQRQRQRGRPNNPPVPGYPYDMQSPFSSYYSNGETNPDYDSSENNDDGYYNDRYLTHKRSKAMEVDPIAMKKRATHKNNPDHYIKLVERFLKDNKNDFSNDRKRRHVGPHDDDGLQRLISTGTIAPSTLPVDHPDYNQTADVVFGTYWFFPAKTQAILPEDQKCIADKLSKEAERTQPSSKYYGMDHDAYEDAIVQECIHKSGNAVDDDGHTYQSQSGYNPYNVHMGQLTVYRLRIKCTCSNTTEIKTGKKRCSRVLPFNQQEWPAYMGANGDSHWRSRDQVFS